jgi:hypothetical protein
VPSRRSFADKPRILGFLAVDHLRDAEGLEAFDAELQAVA